MQESTIQYLLTELPKLHKLFCKDESPQSISFEKMVMMAVMVDQCIEIQKYMKEILVRLDYPIQLNPDEE